ncbi:H-2 class II histocompatibility antigen, E-Q beta chain-like, partial [Cricetulus griseus]
MGPWLPRGSCVAAVVLTLMALSPPVTLVRDPRPRFLQQSKYECHFYNGTQRVQLLERHFYNGEEFAFYDSDTGEYRAVSELGRQDTEDWNSRKELLEQRRAAVDTYCRHNYRIGETFTVQRR